MEVIFNKIHEVVLETLNLRSERFIFFSVIGKWYFNFLESSEKKLSIYIPKYDDEYMNLIYKYTQLFSLIYRLIHKPQLIDFKGTCLFNIFDYNKKRNNFNGFESTFDFVKENTLSLIWSKNVTVSKERFIPIFFKNQIENSHWNSIYNTFELFKTIENKGLINYPVLIDLEKDLCLLLTTGDRIEIKKFVLFEGINWDSKKMTNINAAIYEENLSEQDLTQQITIRYPYNKNIHSNLFNIGRKIFNLTFNSRFYYQNISDDDIILLPSELNREESTIRDFSSKFTIVDTNHNLELFENLNKFKLAWKSYEFNNFIIPFPKYWFTFINQSIPKYDWVKMFESDYPDLVEKPIINIVKVIIHLLFDLNWIKDFISAIKEPVLLLPEIRGLRKKQLEKSLNSFKNYILINKPETIFVENVEDFNYKKHSNLLILDGFNIINLVNILQNNENLKIIIPDFIYFTYQPWIKYHTLNYLYESLFNPIRELLDTNFNINKNTFSKQKHEIVKTIRFDIFEYNKKYNIEKTYIANEEIQIESEDIIFINEEEIEISNKIKEKNEDNELQILTTTGINFKLKSSNQVLLQRTSVISCRASQLKIADCFISMNDVYSLTEKGTIINNIIRFPNSVVKFQVELSKSENIYHILEKLGLQYRNESYFNEKYVIKEEAYTKEKFMLPKRKIYWKIICQYLGINNNDMLQAWILHYGRKNFNEIKEIYKYILNFCVEKDYLSEIENPKLVNEIAQYLDSKKNIFEEGVEINTLEVAKSIMSSIINELTFFEIKEIKTV